MLPGGLNPSFPGEVGSQDANDATLLLESRLEPIEDTQEEAGQRRIVPHHQLRKVSNEEVSSRVAVEALERGLIHGLDAGSNQRRKWGNGVIGTPVGQPADN
jgi:hypothetical protein